MVITSLVLEGGDFRALVQGHTVFFIAGVIALVFDFLSLIFIPVHAYFDFEIDMDSGDSAWCFEVIIMISEFFNFVALATALVFLMLDDKGISEHSKKGWIILLVYIGFGILTGLMNLHMMCCSACNGNLTTSPYWKRRNITKKK